MAKQRSLGDMVKQEAQKVNNSEVETVEAEVVNSAEGEEQEATEKSSTSEATETPMRRKNPTKADLEVKITELTSQITELTSQITELTSQITELTSSLETSRENERTLQEKMLHLQSDIEEKGQVIDRLQEELKRNDVQEELEKAQKTAFQLSETNTKLIEEVETLKKENQELKDKQGPKAKPDKKANLPQLVHRPEHVKNQPKTSSNDDFSQSTWLL